MTVKRNNSPTVFITLHVFHWLSSVKDSGVIHVYDGRGSHEPLHTLTFHSSPLTVIRVRTDDQLMKGFRI